MKDAEHLTMDNEVAITAWFFLIIFLIIYVFKEFLKVLFNL